MESTGPKPARDLDPVTIAAIAVLAYSLANIVHEGLGHGGACLLLGARPTMFNAIFFNYDETTASDTAQRLIGAAGSVVNVIVGLPIIALLRKRPAMAPSLRYFLWLFAAVNLLTSFGYLLYSGVGGIGDWARVIHDIEPSLLFRVTMSAIGAWLYFIVAPGLVMPALDPFLGLDPEERTRRAKVLMLLPYFIGAATLIAAGMFNPLGMWVVLISAAAASLGGTSLLAWYYAKPRKPSALAQSPPLGIARSWGWIAASVVVLAVFVFVLGPGIGKL